MGKIFEPPAEIGGPPDFGSFLSDLTFDSKGFAEAEAAWVERLRAWTKKNSSDEFAGEVVRYPVADGYAHYMVNCTKPVQLIHMPLGDAYAFPYANRWTRKDIVEMVRRERALTRIFSEE